MFYFQNMQKLQLTWLKEEGELFQAVPFSNHSKFYGRHNKSRSASMARNGFMMVFTVIHLFSRTRKSLSVGEFVDGS
jgi:hypothetical protein